MKETKKEAERWWRQAENDLKYARHGLEGNFYAQTCFQCHQVAEKAIKAVHFFLLGKRVVLGHSLVKLGSQIGLTEQITEACAVLDQYYIPTRYPNGLPDGSPFEVYTQKQAEEALETAEKVLKFARKQLDKDAETSKSCEPS